MIAQAPPVWAWCFRDGADTPWQVLPDGGKRAAVLGEMGFEVARIELDGRGDFRRYGLEGRKRTDLIAVVRVTGDGQQQRTLEPLVGVE